MKTCYALFSGGFDSSLALFLYLHDNPKIVLKPVFFLYGQKATKQELQAVRNMTRDLKEYAKQYESVVEDCRIVDIGSNKKHVFSWSTSSLLIGTPDDSKKVGLENRNMVLIACLLSLVMTEIDIQVAKNKIEVVTGFTNNYYDTKLTFVEGLNRFFKSIGFFVELKVPLIKPGQREGTSKMKLAKLARNYNLTAKLRRSWSCYFPKSDGRECDKCDPCIKRKAIFQEIGMKELKNKPKHISTR